MIREYEKEGGKNNFHSTIKFYKSLKKNNLYSKADTFLELMILQRSSIILAPTGPSKL